MSDKATWVKSLPEDCAEFRRCPACHYYFWPSTEAIDGHYTHRNEIHPVPIVLFGKSVSEQEAR